ncbi:MAG: DUF2071 domain-containing protein [Natronomonas sp.]
MGILSMRWRDLLFAHWRVDPETVARRLPDGLSVDTDDGDAYLGVVPFVMESIGVRGVPLGPSFGELNLRTYVVPEDGNTPGVYFFNLDADDRLGVSIARSLFRLPYYRADMTVETDGSGTDRTVRFRSRRTTPAVPPVRFDASYGPTGAFETTDPGSLSSFLIERYRFYATDDDGRIYYGDIEHEPWRLAPARATFRDNTLFRANTFDPPVPAADEPILSFAAPIDVTADRIRRL